MRNLFGAAFRIVAVAGIVGVPATAIAHTVMITPVPRDNSDAHKAAPCGGVARTNKCTSYEAGATIPMKWKETIDHRGCFQVALSTTGDDKNFTVLKQINDPAMTPAGMVYPESIKLPAGVTCKDCTLVVRQLMINQACTGGDASTGPFQNDLDASTYYSCADIRIGDSTPCDGADGGDAGEDEDGGTTEPTDGGVTTTPTDGGGKLVDGGPTSTGTRPDLSGDDEGCNVSGSSSGLSLAALVGIVGFAFATRRRRAR